VGQEPRTGETRLVEAVSSLSYFLMKISCSRKAPRHNRYTWIRRIIASADGVKPSVDRLAAHTVEFQQFLTSG
jgi:hypothetical protein